MTIVLVTGGAGYIGSHCTLALIEAGFDVVIFDNLETGHEEFVDVLIAQDAKGRVLDFVKGDLREYDQINHLFELYDIDIVVHFAAFSLVEESMHDPMKYYRNNVCGSLNLLESMIKNNVMQIVFSSTAAVYGEPLYVPVDEMHPKNPINAYGRSKLMIETMMDDFNLAYGLRSVRLRYFNVVGADHCLRVGESHNPETHLIPNILKSVFDDDVSFKIFGDDYETRDGTCVRDFIDVEDLSYAHYLALNYLLNGGETVSLNLGTKNGSSVKEIFEKCEAVVGTKIDVEVVERRLGDPAVLVADNTNAGRILDWRVSRTLDDSIGTAFGWMKKNQRCQWDVQL